MNTTSFNTQTYNATPLISSASGVDILGFGVLSASLGVPVIKFENINYITKKIPKGDTILSEIHIGDVIQFISTITNDDGDIEDISTATTKDFLFQKPDGSLLTKEGIFLTDGSDGIVFYTTENDDLDQSGTWRYQVHIIYDSNEQHTNITKFKVFSNLPLV